MTGESNGTWDVEQWELDQCRYCKGRIEDLGEAYCSPSCETKWNDDNEHPDNSPASSIFSSHPMHSSSVRSSPRSTPMSSASSTPEFRPVLPASSVPTFPLDYPYTPAPERRNSYAFRANKYGSSLNPVKKSFPSNYYQSTIGDRSALQRPYADKSISLGIRKNSFEEIVPKATSPTEPSDKQLNPNERYESSTPKPNHRGSGLWNWRRLSALI